MRAFIGFGVNEEGAGQKSVLSKEDSQLPPLEF